MTMERPNGAVTHVGRVNLTGHSDMELYESSTDLLDHNTGRHPGIATSERPNGILKSSLPRPLGQANEISNPVFVGHLEGSAKTEGDYYTIAQLEDMSSKTNGYLPNGHLPHGTVSATVNGNYQDMSASMKKKVSFSENVVYTSELTSDIAITGLKPEPEPLPDYDTNNNPGEARVFTRGHVNPNTDITDYDPQTIISPSGIRVDEYELRNRRVWREFPEGERPSGGQPAPPQKGHNEMRFGVCVAVVLVIVAIIGLAALGTLYGITFASDDLSLSEITKKLSLNKTSVVPSLFEDPSAGFPLTSPSSSEGVELHLVSRQGVMTWRRPRGCCVYLTWHKGAALEVKSLADSGLLETHYLGDPFNTKEASYALLLGNSSWHAAKVLDNKPWILISIIGADNDPWLTTEAGTLAQQYPAYRNVILKYQEGPT